MAVLFAVRRRCPFRRVGHDWQRLSRVRWDCKRPGLLKSGSMLFGALACFAVPLVLYLYLPIRSEANPPPNWGDPRTFSRVVDHVLRRQYPSEIGKNPRTVAAFLRQSLYFVRLLIAQFTPSVARLGPVGAGLGCTRRDQRWGRWLAALLFTTASGMQPPEPMSRGAAHEGGSRLRSTTIPSAA